MSGPQQAGLQSLSERQRQVLEAISEATASAGVPPTVRELGQILGITNNAVNDHLVRFERLGLLSRLPGKARSLRVLVTVASSAPRCVCAEALALLEAGNPEGAREILAKAVREGAIAARPRPQTPGLSADLSPEGDHLRQG